MLYAEVEVFKQSYFILEKILIITLVVYFLIGAMPFTIRLILIEIKI